MSITVTDARYRASDRQKRSEWNATAVISVASGAQVGSQDITLNGIITDISYVIPDAVSATAELKLRDSNDVDWFATGELAESTTHILNVSESITGTTTIRIETASAETTGATHTVYLKGK